MSEKIPRASVLLPFSYFLFHNQNLPKMAGNGSSHDEELEEALRLSLIVNNNTTSSTERQSNSTTGVGGTQSRLTASPEEYAQMLAFCLATVFQQSSPPAVSQEPTRAGQPGMGFPLQQAKEWGHIGECGPLPAGTVPSDGAPSMYSEYLTILIGRRPRKRTNKTMKKREK